MDRMLIGEKKGIMQYFIKNNTRTKFILKWIFINIKMHLTKFLLNIYSLMQTSWRNVVSKISNIWNNNNNKCIYDIRVCRKKDNWAKTPEGN